MKLSTSAFAALSLLLLIGAPVVATADTTIFGPEVHLGPLSTGKFGTIRCTAIAKGPLCPVWITDSNLACDVASADGVGCCPVDSADTVGCYPPQSLKLRLACGDQSDADWVTWDSVPHGGIVDTEFTGRNEVCFCQVQSSGIVKAVLERFDVYGNPTTSDTGKSELNGFVCMDGAAK